VTKPTLYYHFGKKEGLYVDMLVQLLEEIGGYIAAIGRSQQPIREQLYELALGYFRNANSTMEPMLRDATALLSEERKDQVWALYRSAMFSPIEDMMSAGMQRGELRQGDANMLARAFLGLLEALTAPGGRAARTEAEHQAVAHGLVEIFLDGAAAHDIGRSVLSS
jgi:AcrR family transcriptional regulator